MDVCVVCVVIQKGQSGHRSTNKVQRKQKTIPSGAAFSAPVQTSPGTHPAPRTMGTMVSVPWVKRPRRGGNHTPSPSAEVKAKVELYHYSPLWAFMGCSRGSFTFIFYHQSQVGQPLSASVFQNTDILKARNELWTTFWGYAFCINTRSLVIFQMTKTIINLFHFRYQVDSSSVSAVFSETCFIAR